MGKIALGEKADKKEAEKKLRDAHQQLRHLEYHVSLGRLVAGVCFGCS